MTKKPFYLITFITLALITIVAAGRPVAAAPLPSQLLLSEIAVTPTGSEFIEIYNPTASAIDLSDVYITDATLPSGNDYYYNIVIGSDAGGGFNVDFHAKFPNGATIAAGEYQTIAVNGSADFFSAYGVQPDYELYEDAGSADAIPDMVEALPGSIDANSGLTNGGEFVVIYYWDGASDLVTDLDYAVWGDQAEAVDKTGISIDGPDAGSTPSTYLDDTPIASQQVIDNGGHSVGDSFQRVDNSEGTETLTGGNGSGGHDETSENLANTWCDESPTPGSATTCVPPMTCNSIPEIQGTGTATPCPGFQSNIEGCVIGIADGGFYFQDTAGDGNALTSDGMFVYGGFGWENPDSLAVGDLVSVTGTVIEFFDTTEFAGDDPLTVNVVGSCTLPTPVLIAPLTDPSVDPDTVYERYEGMRAQMTFDGWVTGPTKRFQSRFTFGDPEIAFVDFNSSIPAYTRVFESDYPGYQGLNYLSGGLNQDLPNLDSGDRIGGTNITGVFAYNFNKFQLMIESATTFDTVDNPDVASSQPAANDAAGEFDICFYNVENLFDNIDDGAGDWGDWAPGYPTSGSAAGATIYNDKLAAHAAQITNEMRSCMVIGLAEVEGQSKIYNDLAAAASAADPDHSWSADFVASGDGRNITQGFLWRDDVSLIGSMTPVSGATFEARVDDGSLDFRRVPALAQFRFNAGHAMLETDIFAYSLHFKSKRSSNSCTTLDCTDIRELEAADMSDLLEYHEDQGEYAIALGDYNDVMGSSPIAILDASADIYNLWYDLPSTAWWSFIFSGESEVLDHIYITNNLTSSIWNLAFGPLHINADFPDGEQASDHDPVRVRFTGSVASAVTLDSTTAQAGGQNAILYGAFALVLVLASGWMVLRRRFTAV